MNQPRLWGCRRRMIGALVLCWTCALVSSSLYHEGSVTLAMPENHNDFIGSFGYSIMLLENPSRMVVGTPSSNGGEVYSCPLDQAFRNAGAASTQNITCKLQTDFSQLEFDKRKPFKQHPFFGASLVNITGGDLLVCAPKWVNEVNEEYLLNGLCYTEAPSEQRDGVLIPLLDRVVGNQFIEGQPYYAHGQAGFSVSATPDHSSLLLGAPGLVSWTGGVIEYKVTEEDKKGQRNVVFNQQPIVNFTKHLHEYSYLGYSVDSGVFELGTTLGVAGAPRGGELLGEVLVFRLSNKETEVPLDVRAHLLGHLRGEYFGATVLATDLNADGRADLLVGAPMYAEASAAKDCCYNQGAVYVYINKKTDNGFELEPKGRLVGSSRSGAMFGYSLADIGDIDGDGYTDVAIGAPFEDYLHVTEEDEVKGGGAVYIYRGSPDGMRMNYSQRIFPNKTLLNGFGFSISRGIDLDKNGCKDLAVGARNDMAAVSIFRCNPTLVVTGAIKVHAPMKTMVNNNTIGIPSETTQFIVEFCVSVKKTKSEWTRAAVAIRSIKSIGLKTEVETLKVYPDNLYCKNQTNIVQPQDKNVPVILKLDLETSQTTERSNFDELMARIGEDSVMSTRRTLYFIDCGDDMVCQPKFQVNFTSLGKSPYVPGTNNQLGVTLSLQNVGEPAYGACVKMELGSETSPVRVPGDCTLKGANLTCNLAAPFHPDSTASWTIQMQKSSNLTRDIHFIYHVHENCDAVPTSSDSITIKVEPRANITLKGHTNLNSTIVSRASLYEDALIEFEHHFEIFNYGPSDWNNVNLEFNHSSEVSVKQVQCMPPVRQNMASEVVCRWPVRAGQPYSARLLLAFRTKNHEIYLNDKSLKVTTTAKLTYGNSTSIVDVSTYISLEPAKPIWPIILAVIVGLLIISLIIYIMYRTGFFVRSKKQELKKLRTGSADAGPTDNPTHTDSVIDLIDEDETTRLSTSEPVAPTSQPGSSRL